MPYHKFIELVNVLIGPSIYKEDVPLRTYILNDPFSLVYRLFCRGASRLNRPCFLDFQYFKGVFFIYVP